MSVTLFGLMTHWNNNNKESSRISINRKTNNSSNRNSYSNTGKNIKTSNCCNSNNTQQHTLTAEVEVATPNTRNPNKAATTPIIATAPIIATTTLITTIIVISPIMTKKHEQQKNNGTKQ